MNLKLTGLRVDIGAVGPGSRGGRVIGRTKSGKPIYASHSHPSHKDFTSPDHKEAANLLNEGRAQLVSLEKAKGRDKAFSAATSSRLNDLVESEDFHKAQAKEKQK